MMTRWFLALAMALVLVLGPGCSEPGVPGETDGAAPSPRAAGPVPVIVAENEDGFVLLRAGEPYEIRGAGLDPDYLDSFVAHGGNSFRTWDSTPIQEILGLLDTATEHGLTVAICLDIGRERQGFDYDDETAVARQFEEMREIVLALKDHPAVLLWIIGNEPFLMATNPKVFDAINDISKMIHEVDGNHPTTTALQGFDPQTAAFVRERAPDLDIISLQKYADIVNVPKYIGQAGGYKPFMITEWGPRGHWEVGETSWGAPIEVTSSEKAAMYLEHHTVGIASQPGRIIGSYVFKWGQKQERTPTWYSMFLPDGSATEVVDVMHFVWKGEWPENRAPQVEPPVLDGRLAGHNVTLSPGMEYSARLEAGDPDGDSLVYQWVLQRESVAQQVGGDREEIPEVLDSLIRVQDRGRAILTAPGEPGAYRLFVYVRDGQGHAGHANVPFLVEG